MDHLSAKVRPIGVSRGGASRSIILAAAVLLVAASPSSGRSQDAVLTEERVLRRIDERLTRIANDARWLEPLPDAVTAVHAVPGSPACLTVRIQPLVAAGPTELRVDRVAGDAFRVVHGGRVLALDATGELLVALHGALATADGPGGLVWSPDGAEAVHLPPAIAAAYRGDRWYVRDTNELVHAVGPTATRVVTDVFRQCAMPVVAISAGDVLRLSALTRSRRKELRTAIIDAGGCRTDSIATDRFLSAPALVALASGELLLVGDHIVSRDALAASAPREADLAAIVAAARAGDDETLRDALSRVTMFGRGMLSGLIHELRQLPDPSAELQRSLDWLVTSATEAGEQLDRLRRSESMSPQAKRTLVEQLETVAAECTAAAARTRAILRRTHPFAPRALAERLSRGHHFYDGLWLQGGSALHADEDRVLLRVRNVEMYDAEPSILAILTGDGRLRSIPLLQSAIERRHGRNVSMSAITAAVDTRGRLLVFSSPVGLGRIEDGALEWIDRSSAVRSMTALLGCDAAGRLYFRQNDERGGPHRFVYTPGAAPPALTPSVRYETAGNPQLPPAVLDGRGRLWFVGRDTRSGGDAAEDATFDVVVDPSAMAAADAARLGSEARTPTLFRIEEDGTVVRLFSDARLARHTLLAGEEGAVALVGDDRAYLVADERVIVAADLHALARADQQLLRQVAARRPMIDRGRSRTTVPAVMATDDVLWVAQGTTMEAYRAGAALGVSERLALLSGPVHAVRLAGVVRAGPVQHVLAGVGTPPNFEYAWATLTAAGEIDIRTIGSESVSFDDDRRMPVRTAMAGAPGLDAKRERILFTTGEHLLETRGPDAYAVTSLEGDVVLVADDGALLVERREGSPFAYVAEGRTSPVDVAWLHDLVPVAVEAEGELICSSWNGLVFLRRETPGSWRITRRIQIDAASRVTRFLGSTEHAWYVTCVSGDVHRIER